MVALATDNFTRADSANLGANWTIAFDVSSHWLAVAISSNTCQIAADPACEYYSAISWPNDQYSQGVVGALRSISVDAQDNFVAVRIASATSSAHYQHALGSDESQLLKELGDPLLGGNFTQLGGNFAAYATNDTARIEVQGTSIRAVKNGTTLSTQTDSAISSGSAGLGGFWDSLTHPTFTSWEGGNFAAGLRLRLLRGMGV